MGGDADIDWVLWSGTVGFSTPVEERIDAALAAGCTSLSVSPLDVEAAERAGSSAAEIGRRARAAGLALIMDPIMNWYEGQAPAGSRFGRFGAAETLSMCEALGVASISPIGQATSDAPIGAVAEAFGELCDRAAAFGARVHLEFVPFTAIADLATAWAIVSEADRPNGGLLFDTWHFFRGVADFALLESIPGDRILAIQVDDAAPEIVGTLREDTARRLLPGDGCFDLGRALGVLARRGALRVVGAEVISPEMMAMEPAEAARLATSRVRAAVAAASG